MSQEFKLRFNQMRENGPAPSQQSAFKDANTSSVRNEYEVSSVRNLRLVWLDGRETFLNYAYLVEADFSPGNELNEIVLNFSGYVVGLKGYRLQPLFVDLFDNIPRTIFQADPRYMSSEESNRTSVVEIMVAKPS